MKPTGSTYIAYERDNPALTAKVRAMVPAQRVINSQTVTSQMPIEGLTGPRKLWNTEHWHMQQAQALFTVYGFETVYDSLSENAMPWHGAKWVNEDGSNARTQDYDPVIYAEWIEAYLRWAALPGRDYRVCVGNEPDADGSPYLNNEAQFREQYRLVERAVRRLRAERTFKGRIRLGAGGWVTDWQRAGSFVRWALGENLLLEFVDIHCYEDPARLHYAREAIGPYPPIAALEAGLDWRHWVKHTDAAQRAWAREMDAATDRCPNVECWHAMHGAAGTSVRALALAGPRGGPTPIGKLALA